MPVIRKQHDSNDFKWMDRFNVPNCFAKTYSTETRRQDWTTLIRDASEKICPTRHIIASIIRHVSNLVCNFLVGCDKRSAGTPVFDVHVPESCHNDTNPWPSGDVLRMGVHWCACTRIRSFVTPYRYLTPSPAASTPCAGSRHCGSTRLQRACRSGRWPRSESVRHWASSP